MARPLDRLVGVELKLPGVGGEGHGVVVPHHPERDEVDQLGNDGIHFARHDRGARLNRRQIDLMQAARGPEVSRIRSLAILDSLIAMLFSAEE